MTCYRCVCCDRIYNDLVAMAPALIHSAAQDEDTAGSVLFRMCFKVYFYNLSK